MFDLILKNIAKHIQLDKAEEDFFISVLQHKIIERKAYLLKEGDICNTENFIIKGCLRTYTIDENGVEHIVMFGIEDWWVGDLYSFLSRMPTAYYIDALEDTEVLQITKKNLDILYERVPKFERFFRLILQNAFIAQQNRINQNLAFTAEQRYVNFIQNYPQLEQRISQKQLSAYLGITPVFLSMLRKKLVHR
ncbi:Crp/Fnr family transcriptional regulator [Flavobacterium wongokense]|uniref:Crp/Fnr family transcriptional regulator n=1 Tax=Flavobacterium wongokense TaxID=2910674 RepID=UPI001F2CBD58|nr:Crp/Fnr family transcriptional regulator [Flavobacterium sp. WG47]MCF6132522.1 Crp/Fnr family transcriptional regulator [Flavobacterium sp. WG47]